MKNLDKTICPHFGICGGCSSQDVPYLDQIKAKEVRVQTSLSQLQVGTWHPIVPSPDIFFYRNKMEFSFGDGRDAFILNSPRRKKGPPKTEEEKTEREVFRQKLDELGKENKVHVGLHPKGRFALVTPGHECLLLSEESQKIMDITALWATEKKIPVYLRKDNSGVLRHLLIREGKNTGERLVNLFTSEGLDDVDDLASALQLSGIPISTFIWTENPTLSDVADGIVRKIFWGPGHIHERVESLNFRVKPNSFMQTNTKASEGMIGLLAGWAESESADVLVDLYCGTGPIGLNLAEKFDQVIGVESNRLALAEAQHVAESNKIEKAEFISGRVEDLTELLTEKLTGKNSLIVVDPPRAGLHKSVVEMLLSLEPGTIFYVSCNPDSLARDLTALSSKYSILDAVPMDFFPHTDHVETAVRLKKVASSR